VLLNLFRFRSRLAIDHCFLIHSIARIWPIIRAHMAFIVGPWYLLYFIHSMLSVMQLIGYRSTILKHGLITDSALQIVFIRLISIGAIWKEVRRSDFLLADWFTTDESSFTVCANIPADAWRIVGTYSDECRVCFLNESAVLKESNTSCYI